MHPDLVTYNAAMPAPHRAIVDALAPLLSQSLPKADARIWHRAPVWFIDGNPIVGYASRKKHVTLLFWSGQSFDEPALKPEGSFKAAEIHYTDPSQINAADLARWLDKAQAIQWDYKNIVKRKGKLEKIGTW